MKKSIFTSALLITSLLFAGCNNAQTDNTQTINSIQSDNSEVISASDDRTDNSKLDSVNDRTETSTSANKNYNQTKNSVKNVSQTIAGKGQPKVGTIKRIEQGDLACYVNLIDEKGKEHNISADFNICTDKEQFLNQKVKLSYKILTFNDCQSIEPCGKTKKESAIVKMEVISSSTSGDT